MLPEDIVKVHHTAGTVIDAVREEPMARIVDPEHGLFLEFTGKQFKKHIQNPHFPRNILIFQEFIFFPMI